LSSVIKYARRAKRNPLRKIRKNILFRITLKGAIRALNMLFIELDFLNIGY